MRNASLIFLLLVSLLPSSAIKADTAIYFLNTPAATGWTSMSYDVNHPYWLSIAQAIERAAQYYTSDITSMSYDPDLIAIPVEFTVLNSSHYTDATHIALVSEFMAMQVPPHLIIFYNPLATAQTARITPKTQLSRYSAPVNPDNIYDPPSNITLDEVIHHEVGHLRWSRLCDLDREVWEEVWGLAQDLWLINIKPNYPYNFIDQGNMTSGNYFNVDAAEGFATAWGRFQTQQPLDTTIQNYFEHLAKVGHDCNDWGQLHFQSKTNPISMP